MSMMIDACKRNKSLIISAVVLVFLSVCLSAIVTINFYFTYNKGVMTAVKYFAGVFIKLGISFIVFAIACRYGYRIISKFSWCFVVFGIVTAILCDANGQISGYNFDVLSLADALALMGLAVFFFRYAVKTVSYSVAYVCMSLMLSYVNPQNEIKVIMFIMSLLLIFRALKNKQEASVTVLNIIPSVVLGVWAVGIIINAVSGVVQNFYDTGTVAYTAREVYSRSGLFSSVGIIHMTDGMLNFKLLWLVDNFGYVTGIAVFIALTVFVYNICRKCCSASDRKDICMAIASIIAVRYVISVLANLGFVLYGLSSPIPVLSDGAGVYFTVGIMLGTIVGRAGSVPEKVKQFIRRELSGWSVLEVIWLIVSVLIIVGLSIYWNDTIMGIISSTTGVMYVVLAGKGKLSAYIFGLVNCIFYAIISYQATYYGETMLNALYYLPMQFVGFYVWSKNMNTDTGEVNKRHMRNKERLLVILVTGIVTYIYGLILKRLGDTMPFVDSFTTVCSVVTMIVSVKMFSEQWWMWGAVNACSVYMWWTNFSKGQENIATLIMWIMYLCNAVIMLVKWEREIYKSKQTGRLI